ncbi:MAG: DUF885 domain-containing protein [Proteobacteria bacterium]|nr:DUF885 domain-containing protein [Pseudomonadota bacterium]
MKFQSHYLIAILILATLGACEPAGDKKDLAGLAEPANQQMPWADFRESFIEEYFEHSPAAAIRAGRHEFDGQLHDYSPAAVAAEIAWLKERRAQAEAYADDALAGREKFERSYLMATADKQLFFLEHSGFLQANVVVYAFAIDPSIYLSLEYAPLRQRMAAFSRHAAAIPAYLTQMRSNLVTPLARPHIVVSRSILAGYATFFANDVPQIFSAVDDAGLQADFSAANAGAIEALKEMTAWLDSELETASDDFALGEEKFLRMLRMAEGVDIGIAELKAAGQADLERNLAALVEVCDVFAPGLSIHECAAKNDRIKMAGGPVEGARRQLADLKQFLIEKDLVSIPGTEQALVDEAPPYNRWNFAYIRIPGPYEDGLPSTYYIAPPDPAWSEEDRLAYIPGAKKLLYVSVHEVWPGHFLNFLHANRSESAFGRTFFTYSYTEGWAHYTEEMMFDAGLDGQAPDSRIGQLSNALLRNVRFLSAIGLHTEGMTVAESRQMFIDKGVQDSGNASQQAFRGTFDPGYLNYTLGKLMIKKLRDDWTASRGGRAAWKEFHDTFLSYGAPPIPLVRADMLAGDESSDKALLPY